MIQPETRPTKSRNSDSWRTQVSALSLLLALTALFMIAMAGYGHRMDVWHFSWSIKLFRWAVWLGAATAVVGLVGSFLGARARSSKSAAQGLFGLLIGSALLANGLIYQARAKSVPPIHDITTDTENPPVFDGVLALRKNSPNSATYAGAEIAEQQRKAYPEIKPIVVIGSPRDLARVAILVAQDLGWRIISADVALGTVEASARTPWMGFVDDVVIRIQPFGQAGVGVPRSQVDVRSASRVGKSDVGANAERIRKFLDKFSKLVSGAKVNTLDQ